MSWRKLYDSCVCETNPIKLEKLVFELEDAIVLRYHDLAGKPNLYEFQAITRVAELLRQLKIEKLGWPDPAKQEFRFLWINWRTLVSRSQAALLVAKSAWQNWVFKSLK